MHNVCWIHFFYSIFNDAKNKHSTKLLVQKGIIMMGIPRDRAMKCIMKQKWIFNLDCETIKTYFMRPNLILFENNGNIIIDAPTSIMLFCIRYTKTRSLKFVTHFRNEYRSIIIEGIDERFSPW